MAALEREEMFKVMNEYQIKGWFFTTIKNKNIDNIRKRSRLDYQWEVDIFTREDSFEEQVVMESFLKTASEFKKCCSPKI